MSVAIIGGTGFYRLASEGDSEMVSTPYGDAKLKRCVSTESSQAFWFLPRHGEEHNTPPHKINYRANIDALRQRGVRSIIATNAVGGIAADTGPGKCIVPDQVIDYTFGREHTFYNHFSEQPAHIDFTYPFSEHLREKLLFHLKRRSITGVNGGVYGCVQGPRLESAAEVKKYAQDGCTVLGMTGMPEAALAREAGMNYASICFSVNWAAGVKSPICFEEIVSNIQATSDALRPVLLGLVEDIA